MMHLLILQLLTLSTIALKSNFAESAKIIDAEPFLYKVNIETNIGNVKVLNLSDVGKEIRYIPLETTPISLITEIQDVEFSSSFIFVGDIDKLLQFDINGKFIRKIGSQGRGPQDYLSVLNFCIDEKAEEIYILNLNSFLIFDFEGNFKKSYKLTFRPAQISLSNEEGILFHLPNISSPSADNTTSWVLTNKQGIVMQRFKNTLRRYNLPGFSIAKTPFYKFGDSVHFMEFAVDTLYYLDGTQKMPHAVFYLGNLKMDPDPLITYAAREEVSKRLRDKFYIHLARENYRYIFIDLAKGLSTSHLNLIFNKTTSETIVLKDNGFQNDLDGGILFWPKFVFNDNILVSYIESFELLKILKQRHSDKSKTKSMSKQLVSLSKSISEESNPVLIVVK
jgi:hypothetical protein